jgi:hypothetical protein
MYLFLIKKSLSWARTKSLPNFSPTSSLGGIILLFLVMIGIASSVVSSNAGTLLLSHISAINK